MRWLGKPMARFFVSFGLLLTVATVAHAREAIWIQAVNFCATDEGPCCNGCKCGIHCDGHEGWNFSSVRCNEENNPDQ